MNTEFDGRRKGFRKSAAILNWLKEWWYGGDEPKDYGDAHLPGFSKERVQDQLKRIGKTRPTEAVRLNAALNGSWRWDPDAGFYRMLPQLPTYANRTQQQIAKSLTNAQNAYGNDDYRRRVLQTPLLVDLPAGEPIYDPENRHVSAKGRLERPVFNTVTDYVKTLDFSGGREYYVPMNYTNIERAAIGDQLANERAWLRTQYNLKNTGVYQDPKDMDIGQKFRYKDDTGSLRPTSGNMTAEDPQSEEPTILESWKRDGKEYRKYSPATLAEEALHKVDKGPFSWTQDVIDTQNAYSRAAGLGDGGYAANSYLELAVANRALELEFMRRYRRKPSPSDLMQFSKNVSQLPASDPFWQSPERLANVRYYRKGKGNLNGGDYRRLLSRLHYASEYDKAVKQGQIQQQPKKLTPSSRFVPFWQYYQLHFNQ